MYLTTGILMTIGGGLMYTITASSPLSNIYGYSILLALGSGLTFSLGYAIAGIKAAQKGWSAKDVQDAVSLQNVSQLGGTLFCLLILGQIFQSLAFQNLQQVLGGEGFSDAEIRSAIAGAQSQVFGRLSSDSAERATWAIT